jgi:hypothetical protein
LHNVVLSLEAILLVISRKKKVILSPFAQQRRLIKPVLERQWCRKAPVGFWFFLLYGNFWYWLLADIDKFIGLSELFHLFFG